MIRLLILALLSVFALAASEHHGLVRFGGLPVPGATVTATQGDKKFVTITDPQGFYSFADLPDGIWTIQVDMLCFAPMKREIGVMASAPAAEWDLKLQPFDEIKAAAPPPPAPPPAAPVTAAPAPQAGIAAAPPKPSLPAGKQSKRASTKKADTAAAPTPAQTGFQRTDVNASADTAKQENENGTENGATGEMNQVPSEGFLINGSVNNGAASPFAQAAAFGNFRRGPRSLYTGGLGVILDNSALNARSFSLTGQDTPKPSYSHIQGVASLGGPIKIPWLWRNQNYPNFFINYQWTRNRNANTQPGLMPVAAERDGDFSQAADALGQPVRLFDPLNGMPVPGNVIPASRISPQARALLGLYPLPNFADNSRYNYQVPVVGASHQDALQSRVNKTIGRKNQLVGMFALQSTRADNPSLFGFLDTADSTGINASATWRHTFRAGIFGTFSAQYNRLAARTTPYFANRINISGDAGISGNNQEPVNWGPPNLSFSSGITPLSDAQYSFTRNQTTSLSGSVFWSHRSHNITAGADFRKQQFNLLSQQNPRGGFLFTGAATQATANSLAIPGTGFDFADFLLGIPTTSSIAYGNADKYFRAPGYSVYFTDDWRIRSGLTINAGMRWEYGAPITELYGRLVNLDIAPGFVAEAPVVAFHPAGSLTGQRYPDSLVQPDKHAFQPRIGIAWRPLLASSLVIRAGYGIYYNTSLYMPIATQMAQQSPLSKSMSVPNSAANPLTLANGFIASPTVTPNTFAVDPSFRAGYAQTWNASIQRDLPFSLIMTATYLGTKGTRQQQAFLPNTFPAGAVNPCPACPAGYAYLASNGNSSRHAGQFQLRRRLHNGLTATVQYTFAKAIDDAALGGRGQGGSLIAQNWLDLSAERSLSNFDQRHLANITVQYTTGMGLGGGALMGGWRGSLFQDWTFATQITAGSGFPLTPVYVSPVKGTGVAGSIRPDYTGASIYDAPLGLFLNPAAVATPPAGEWGNAGRNSITGPSQFSLNASMARTFRMSDRLNFDLRFDATNALNHVTYPSWGTTLGSAQFGLPLAANPMRSMQVTARMRF